MLGLREGTQEGQTGKVSLAGGVVQSLDSREVCNLARGGLQSLGNEEAASGEQTGPDDQKPGAGLVEQVGILWVLVG